MYTAVRNLMFPYGTLTMLMSTCIRIMLKILFTVLVIPQIAAVSKCFTVFSITMLAMLFDVMKCSLCLDC